ncbi:hypothetical protein PIB30_011489 [Stylosanthes scabra]|uniref:Uncharacterized protein n=1 Tax=Stylosanthes scabra TaxID=79078 RepID=A0ABU6S697_9FABA|nr:hypothetical protein [Stylosanthes scabra]
MGWIHTSRRDIRLVQAGRIRLTYTTGKSTWSGEWCWADPHNKPRRYPGILNAYKYPTLHRFDISEHTILLCLNSIKTLSDLSVGVFCRFSPTPVSLEIHQLDSLRQPKLGADWAHLVMYLPWNNSVDLD